MKHYEELGVPPSADDATIKKAYRRRAKKAHPDKGGSDEEMARVNRAYAVLSDPMRKARYDASGDDDDEASTENAPASMIAAGFMELLKKDIHEAHTEWVAGWIRGRRVEVESEKKAIEKAIDYLSAKKGDIRYKPEKGQNLYASTIDHELRRLEAAKMDAQRRIQICVDAIDRLRKEYEDKPKKKVTTSRLVYAGAGFPFDR